MKVANRKARYNYQILETLEAGIVLTGAEVKSVKQGRISLEEAFIKIDPHQEAWLVNCHIAGYQFANNQDYKPRRKRKLLLHKKETLYLVKKKQAGKLTIIPVSCYTTRGKIKVKLGLARGKKKWQKKDKKKRRDLDRQAKRALKDYQ